MHDLNKLQDAFSLVAEYAEKFQSDATLSFEYDLSSAGWVCFEIYLSEINHAHFCDIDHMLDYLTKMINQWDGT